MKKYNISTGNIFNKTEFIGTFKQKGNLLYIFWDKINCPNLVLEKYKLFGFIPWERRVLKWTDASLPDTPNPYIIPTKDVNCICEIKK